MKYYIFLLTQIFVLLAASFNNSSEYSQKITTDDYFPSHFRGALLEELPLDKQTKRFAKNFPGKIARFTDGEQELIFRSINRPSRKLHPSTDCFKGYGYRVTPKPLYRDPEGNIWGAAMQKNTTKNIQFVSASTTKKQATTTSQAGFGREF